MERRELNRVNAAFTIPSYPQQMVDRVQAGMKLFVCAIAVLFGIGVAATGEARAQNADIDWADAGVASQGSVPSPTTVTGSDGTSATVTFNTVTDGGTFTSAAFAGDFLSYFNGQIGDGTSLLFANFDNSAFDPDDRVIITITLSEAVTGLQFSLSDVDTGSNTDAVEVFFDDDLAGGFTNAANDNALWSIGPSVTRTNNGILNGWRGTNSSDQFTTNGDVDFDFGNNEVRRIQIVYFSYTGTGDPTGQFIGISDLFYNAPGVDLSLNKSVSNATPTAGSAISYTLSLSNTGTDAASNVQVRDILPTGFNFTSASGFGSYDEASGIWQVSSVASGQTRTLTINGTVSAPNGVTITNYAEVFSSPDGDIDSTPGNDSFNEDDDATASFTVQGTRTAGTPPALSCPAGVTQFDWDSAGIVWQAGVLDQNFTLPDFGVVNFLLSSQGTFENDANFGGQSPAESTANSGGLPTSESSLHKFIDFDNRQQTATTVITLPNAIPGAQFTIFDIDFAANDFADMVTVTGSYQGSTVLPILTNGTANYVVGNTAIGDATSANNEGAGNVVVTFNQSIDTITIVYGNASTAPAVPDGQAIAFHDFDFCSPQTTLSVSKVSSIISDPINGITDPKAIPGATVEYLITVTNTGLSNTDPGTVVVWDDGPADAKMCLIARSGGPVIFGDPGSNSNLTYDYGGAGSVETDLAVTTDDLEFSDDDGVTFDYTPIDDGEGCDTLITDFRVNPAGSFAAGGNFTITVRYEIE